MENLFISTLIRDPALYMIWIGIVAFSICVHEYAHALTALKCGDDTAAEHGHLSLNPLVQMGPMSIMMLLIIGLAWGAVPVNETQLRQRYHAAFVASAGPGANLLLCLAFAMLTAVSMLWGTSLASHENLIRFFRIGSSVNGMLFCLNILPIPMLDGWSILSYFIPRLRSMSPETIQHFSWIFLLVIFLTPLFDFIWRSGIGLSEFLIRLCLGALGILG